jgi:hypothetical protein
LLFSFDRQVLFDGCGQFLVVGIDDDDREQLCRQGGSALNRGSMATSARLAIFR